MNRVMSVAVLLLLLCAVVSNAFAYTYTYTNGTSYKVRVFVQLYDDADKTAEIEPNGSYVISSTSLLKSWTAEAFLEDSWQRVLDMTCDLLPGNHTFSIYFDEKNDPAGKVMRTWNALIK